MKDYTYMKSIIITPPNAKDFEFLSDLIKKLGFDSQILDEEEQEDYALLKNMVQDRKGDYVSDEEVTQALNI